MCVLICANLKACELFEIGSARAYREMLQLSPVCPGVVASNAVHKDLASQSPTAGKCELDVASQPRIMKRSAWLQAYCRYQLQLAQDASRSATNGGSSHEWQKAFEAVAKTWGRLLALVGLCW